MSTKIEVKGNSFKKKGEGKKKEEQKPVSQQQKETRKGPDTKELKNKLKKSNAEIKKLKAELSNLKTDYLRQLADKENLRKRLEREKNEFFQHALGEIFLDFLVILDNFERALKTDTQNDEKSLRDGVELIYKQFLSLLEKKGVRQISIEDHKFDPRFHQAFATTQSPDVKEAKIDEEYQKGYTLHDRLLRPALVKVIIPSKEE